MSVSGDTDRPGPSDPVRLATELQRQAADPLHSVVLRASAGSGKTKVLVDRFIRLCLAGSSPKAILAVTFTKKAAVQIKDRLLQRTRRYALVSADELRELLEELLGRQPTRRESARAADLHEQILEDFAGLHIGTIHAFCQLVLGRFAAEVGLDPRFRVLEKEDELWLEALDRLEREVASDDTARADLSTIGSSPDQVRQRLTRLRLDRVHLERWLARIRRDSGAEEPSGPRVELLPALLTELQSALFVGTEFHLESGSEPPRLIHLAAPAVAAAEALASTGLERILAAEPAVTAGLTKQSDQLRSDLAELSVNYRQSAGTETAERAVRAFLIGARTVLLTSGGTLRVLTGKKDSKVERQQNFATEAAELLDICALADLVDLFQHNVRLLRHGLRALDIFDELKRRDR
ncbi:MAG: UvrD-helicase domain-containing protein, partial [bacterium]